MPTDPLIIGRVFCTRCDKGSKPHRVFDQHATSGLSLELLKAVINNLGYLFLIL